MTAGSVVEDPITAEEIDAVRDSPLLWFEGCGKVRDEGTNLPVRVKANVLQRRIFEHYRRCQEAEEPCRMVVLKYRRAGSSTASSALMYVHAQNYVSRSAVAGTDYKSSQNMQRMISHFAQHDDFPGWMPTVKEKGFKEVLWESGSTVTKEVATRLEFATKSTVELFTAQNPEACRSAGLNAVHLTECGRWPTGGVMDAAQTLSSVRNALPKSGFHLAIEESTAEGAGNAFCHTCETARYPDYADWPQQYASGWPLAEVPYGKELQFVFIFAAWFEDERHVPGKPLTPEQIADIEATLDEDEQVLIQRFGQQGARGQRLGSEVNATVWEQLAWRRAIIATVCTKGGVDEFKQEYPSCPEEAFRASGAPALDQEGVAVLQDAVRRAGKPRYVTILDGKLTDCPENRSRWTIWEELTDGCSYLVVCDPMSGAEAVTGTGEKDRHAVFVIRDAYQDKAGVFHRLKVVARLKPPCQWEDEIVTDALEEISAYYGRAIIVVEGNAGTAILKSLNNRRAPLFLREVQGEVGQPAQKKLGWWTDAQSRRVAISALQEAVREQAIELLCPHAVHELAGLVINNAGKVEAGGSGHDDDALALAIGLACMHAATRYSVLEPGIKRFADDHFSWKGADGR